MAGTRRTAAEGSGDKGGGPRSTVGYLMMRMTIAVVFAAAFAISGAAQSGAPAVAFPKTDRPVADIGSPIWHDEKGRDDADEPSQLGRLLGIKSGSPVADIAARNGY